MNLLASRLTAYSGHAFDDQERLIFALGDTEYYPIGSAFGFNTLNLVNILYNLDISMSHCILFTNHHGMSASVKELCQQYGSEYPIQVIESNYTVLQSTGSPPQRVRSADDIQYHYCFLSNTRRDHRTYLRCFLEDPGHRSKTLMAWATAGQNTKVTAATAVEDYQVYNKIQAPLLKTEPFTRIRDKIIPSSAMQTVYHQYHDCLETTVRDPLIASVANQNNFDADFLKHCFINLVAETAYDYPYPYLSEKTFKNFYELSPFVFVGPRGGLAYLKNIGFKTFEQWIDETYDRIVDPAERLDAIFTVLTTVSKWSLEHCRLVYNEMQGVLEHNRQHYLQYYCQDSLGQTLSLLN
jgi:hypothetical protein